MWRRPSTLRFGFLMRCMLAVSWLGLVASAARGQAGSGPVPPRLLTDAAPPYPEAGGGIPARVVLEIVVSKKGRVTEASVVEVEHDGAGVQAFEEAALRHVGALRFRPALRTGEPVPARIRYAVRFVPPLETKPSGNASPGAQPRTSPLDPTRHVHEHAHEAPGEPATKASYEATARIAAGTDPSLASSASDFEIDVGALRDVPRRDAEELLTLAPGMVLANHAGEGHASTLYLRGFDAGEGQDVAVRVDGVPLNEPSNAHAHGYADSHFVIPELVQRVRVLEGPFDPGQSDFAVAGSVEYRLAVERRGVHLQGEYGSFDTRRLLAVWAPVGAKPGTFVGVDLRDGDGYGPNQAHGSASVLARYEGGSDALRWSLLAASHALRFDSAGVIREDAFRARRLPCDDGGDAQFFCLHDPSQGGSASRHLVSGALQWRKPGAELSQRVWLQLRRNRFRENFTGMLLDERGDGLDEHYRAITVGLRGRYRVGLEVLADEPHIELGYVARHDRGRTWMWRLRREGDDPYETVFDDELALTHLGLYGLVELRLGDRLALRGGVRVDTFGFSVVDRNRPRMDRVGERLPSEASDAWGTAVSPRGSLRVRLVDGLSWVTSAGLGARSSDAQALSEGERAPFARVRAVDTGLTLEHATAAWSLALRSAAFWTQVSQDLVFDPERGRNVPVGRSNRYGALASARLGIGERLDVLGSFTYAEARQPPEDASFWEITAGPSLPFVPRVVARLDAAFRQPVRLGGQRLRAGLATGMTYIGPKPLPLSTQSEDILTFDAALRVAWRALDVSLEARNVLDARYRQAEFHYVSDFGDVSGPGSRRAVRHFSAGPPRSLRIALAVHFDRVGRDGSRLAEER